MDKKYPNLVRKAIPVRDVRADLEPGFHILNVDTDMLPGRAVYRTADGRTAEMPPEEYSKIGNPQSILGEWTPDSFHVIEPTIMLSYLMGHGYDVKTTDHLDKMETINIKFGELRQEVSPEFTGQVFHADPTLERLYGELEELRGHGVFVRAVEEDSVMVPMKRKHGLK